MDMALALGNIVVVWGGVYLVMLDHYWLVHRCRVLYLYAAFCSNVFMPWTLFFVPWVYFEARKSTEESEN